MSDCGQEPAPVETVFAWGAPHGAERLRCNQAINKNRPKIPIALIVAANREKAPAARYGARRADGLRRSTKVAKAAKSPMPTINDCAASSMGNLPLRRMGRESNDARERSARSL